MTDEDTTPHSSSLVAFGEETVGGDTGDFAEEHDDTSFADDPHGGPEHVEEEETPRGHAGMD